MFKTIRIASIALCLAHAAQAASTTAPAAQIEAAERAFAADAPAMGMRDSFLKYMADDAIIFTPDPTNARAFYGSRPSQGGPKLEWHPAWIVAAKSGDLGLSTGPTHVNDRGGHWYASIWRKEADGSWRWIYDGGAAADTDAAPSQATPAVVAPVSTSGEKTPATAFDAVRTAEATLSQAAQKNVAQAYKSALSVDAHLSGPRGASALSPTAQDQRLALRPTTMSLTLRGGGASKAGDLVWTHGEAHWGETGQNSVAAHYMHVWQRRPEGWRLIFETLINDR